jgi:hypothetical protein
VLRLREKRAGGGGGSVAWLVDCTAVVGCTPEIGSHPFLML